MGGEVVEVARVGRRAETADGWLSRAAVVFCDHVRVMRIEVSECDGVGDAAFGAALCAGNATPRVTESGAAFVHQGCELRAYVRMIMVYIVLLSKIGVEIIELWQR